MGEHDQLVAAERDRLQAAIGRLERQDTEVEAAVEDLGRNLARPHAPDLDERLRVRLGEPVEEGQQRVHGRLVGTDDDAPAANLLQLAHRDFRVRGERQQPPGVLLKQASRFGQGAVADGPIEQSIAELFLEAADRLAHGRLGAMQLLGGDRKAAFGRNRDKCAQILQLHRLIIIWRYLNQTSINWTAGWSQGYNVLGASNYDDDKPADDLRHDAARRGTGSRLLAADR